MPEDIGPARLVNSSALPLISVCVPEVTRQANQILAAANAASDRARLQMATTSAAHLRSIQRDGKPRLAYVANWTSLRFISQSEEPVSSVLSLSSMLEDDLHANDDLALPGEDGIAAQVGSGLNNSEWEALGALADVSSGAPPLSSFAMHASSAPPHAGQPSAPPSATPSGPTHGKATFAAFTSSNACSSAQGCLPAWLNRRPRPLPAVRASSD
jgi:hypothetical protein